MASAHRILRYGEAMAVRETIYHRLERTIGPWVRKGELQRAIAHCEAELGTVSRTEYHNVLGRFWLGQTREAAHWLSRFYQAAAKTLPVHTLYCEMNRFEINPGEWYLDIFAYD